MTRGKTIIIQGGQYGSEGKGQIAAAIAKERAVWAAVRTGSINAGHTVYRNGVKFSMQILPTAFIHPGIMLVLGAGCYIHPKILMDEVNKILAETGEDIRQRLIIDNRCVWFGDEETDRAREANRHHAMGATGKGASEGIITKMRDRGGDAAARLFKNHPLAASFSFGDTVRILNAELRAGHNILLEGTQGALLDFNTGPYPFVTTRMTNAPAWLAEAGLPPVNVETILVLRSYPIRVAGNSGPMPDEISWPILAREINNIRTSRGLAPLVREEAIHSFELALARVVTSDFPDVGTDVGSAMATDFHLWSDEQRQLHRVCLSEANARALQQMSPTMAAELAFFEKTTVTKKLRRVSRFDYSEAKLAILMNAPTSIAYTFVNYDQPEIWGETDVKGVMFATRERCDQLQTMLGVPVDYVTTERYQENVINLRT